MKKLIKRWLDIKTEDVNATSYTLFGEKVPSLGYTQYDINDRAQEKSKRIVDGLDDHKESILLLFKHLGLKKVTKPGTCTEDENILITKEEELAMKGDYTKPLKKSKK